MNRDLDAEIVEKIFNWQPIPVSGDYNGENCCEILYPPGPRPGQDFYSTLPLVGTIHRGWAAPKYSDDLKLAIQLAKRVSLPILLIEMPLEPEVLSQMALDHFLKTNQAGHVKADRKSTVYPRP